MWTDNNDPANRTSESYRSEENVISKKCKLTMMEVEMLEGLEYCD